MWELLLSLIEQHVRILAEIMVITERIRIQCQEGLITEVANESENRQRIINILSGVQEKIERLLATISFRDGDKEKIDQLKLWQLNFNKMVEAVNEVDQNILEILERDKNETSRQIAAIFKSKESFRGYNLLSVKK